VKAPAQRQRWDGDVLHVSLFGRLAAEEVDFLAGALTDARQRGRRFVVVLDRRRLGASTAKGRMALEQWTAASLPTLCRLGRPL
jgi:hypothetical protein